MTISCDQIGHLLYFSLADLVSGQFAHSPLKTSPIQVRSRGDFEHIFSLYAVLRGVIVLQYLPTFRTQNRQFIHSNL